MHPSIVVVLLSSLVAVSRAETVAPSSATLSLSQVLDAARRDNPDIRAAYQRWQAARKKVSGEYTPENPRVVVERMYAPDGASPVSGAPEKGLLISQEFPFPTTLYLRGSRAAKEAELFEQAYRAKVREVLARAQGAYAMLYLATKSRRLLDENVELMRRFSKVAESKYAAGLVAGTDALKAQVELTKMLNQGVTVDQERELAAAELNALMGRSAWEPLGAPGDLDARKLEKTREELEAVAFSRRPELRQAALAVELADASLSLARSEFLPDVMVAYRRRSDPMRGRTSDAMLGFSVPLWFWKPASRAAEASAQRETARAELSAAKLATAADLRAAFVRAQTARRLAESYQNGLLPQAESALTVAESGYRAGRSTFLDLLDAQRSLLNFRLEYYQYVAEYELRTAELERVIGETL